jgi:hypothetical protein
MPIARPIAPLESLVSAYIQEAAPDTPRDFQQAALTVIASMARGQLRPEDAFRHCRCCLGTDSPAQRIHSILSVSTIPLPDTSFQSARENRSKARPWTAIEDQRLIAGILRFGLEHWAEVAHFVGNGRTRPQCSQRWKRGLDPSIFRGSWSKEEEDCLFKLVATQGTSCWGKIAAQIGNRSDVQCRYHYIRMQKSLTPAQSPETQMPSPGSIEEILDFAVSQHTQVSLGQEGKGIFSAEVPILEF